jgi:hypothetical protein
VHQRLAQPVTAEPYHWDSKSCPALHWDPVPGRPMGWWCSQGPHSQVPTGHSACQSRPTCLAASPDRATHYLPAPHTGAAGRKRARGTLRHVGPHLLQLGCQDIDRTHTQRFHGRTPSQLLRPPGQRRAEGQANEQAGSNQVGTRHANRLINLPEV